MFCCLSEGSYMLSHLLVLIDGDFCGRKKKRSKKKEEAYKFYQIFLIFYKSLYWIQDDEFDEPEDIKRIAPWTKQITVRGIVASIAIGIIYSVIVMKLNLTTGLVPNLNVSAALLAFAKRTSYLMEKDTT
ncbi:hypothetical protein NC651_027970 [Populus alba x Populus x berolinensis]|nr:hypothetical protein NC651_027970 [Populus alba x Populus x berolinensis]